MFKRALALALIGFAASGCGPSLSTYVKPEAPWGAIKRVAVLPFALPSENPVQRDLATHLFCEELRNTHRVEVVEVSSSSAQPVAGGAWDIRKVGKDYQADAVVSGSVDDMNGTVIHMQVQDVATEELLWSGTYLLGVRSEFFSFKTQQQQFKNGFRWLSKQFASDSASSS